MRGPKTAMDRTTTPITPDASGAETIAVPGLKCHREAELNHGSVRDTRVGIRVYHVLSVRLDDEPRRHLGKIGELDRGFGPAHGYTILLLPSDIMRPVTGNGRGDAGLVVRTVRQQPGRGQSSAEIHAKAINSRIGDAKLNEPRDPPLVQGRQQTIQQQIGAGFAPAPFGIAVGGDLTQIVEVAGVVPRSDRYLVIVGWQTRESAEARPWGSGRVGAPPRVRKAASVTSSTPVRSSNGAGEPLI